MKGKIIAVIKIVTFCMVMAFLGFLTSDGDYGDTRALSFLCAAIICIIGWSEIIKMAKGYKE